jgi:hypothetical protein
LGFFVGCGGASDKPRNDKQNNNNNANSESESLSPGTGFAGDGSYAQPTAQNSSQAAVPQNSQNAQPADRSTANSGSGASDQSAKVSYDSASASSSPQLIAPTNPSYESESTRIFQEINATLKTLNRKNFRSSNQLESQIYAAMGRRDTRQAVHLHDQLVEQSTVKVVKDSQAR